jgi:putative PIN family toxin of toxin-antitoxin system
VPSTGDVRAVADTNVLLSGLFWRGRPHALLEQVRAGTLTLISSPALLAELAEVMNRPKFQAILVRSNTDPDQTLGELRRLVEIIDPPPLPAPVSRDPSDDATRPSTSTTGTSPSATTASSSSGRSPLVVRFIDQLRPSVTMP